MGANTNAPCGFAPLELGNMYRAHMYRITNDYGTDLFMNDPVAVVTAGTIERATAGSAGVILGTIVGLFMQDGPTSHRPENLRPLPSDYLFFDASGLGSTYDYWALVADDPDQIFYCQEDSDTTPLQITHIGANCDHVAGTGSSVTGISGAMLDSSSANSGADLQWRLLNPAYEYDLIAGQWNTVYDGATASVYTKWIVRCNMHQLARRTAGLA
jgi:hypothetical protein